jgi:hypothetical protein
MPAGAHRAVKNVIASGAKQSSATHTGRATPGLLRRFRLRAPRFVGLKRAVARAASVGGSLLAMTLGYINMRTPMIAVMIAPITIETMIAQMMITIVYQTAFSGGVFITGGSPSHRR